MNDEPVWNGRLGTAGGATFGAALATLAKEREVPHDRLAQALEISPEAFEEIVAGRTRVGVAGLARLAHALRLRPIEFMQRSAMLSLESYAFGLDPLYFLPEGQLRYDARIYMREINPRHPVPEGDMTKRNPSLKVLADDTLLDPLGKLEIELAYLLRTAVQVTGGAL